MASLIGMVSCSHPSQDLHIRAALGGTALTDLEIHILPFDPDELLDSLESAADAPKPSFPELEASLRTYRRRTDGEFADASETWHATRDSVEDLSRQLFEIDRASALYRARYRDFRELYSRLMRRGAERDVAIRSLTAQDRQLAGRAGAAADSIRLWEARNLREYPRLASERLEDLGRPAATVVTDEEGGALLGVAPGRWWLLAKMKHPENPFLEYHWNELIHTRGWMKLAVVPLDDHNARLRFRH